MAKRGLPDHPKTKEFAELLGVPRVTAIGHLELLFHFTANYAPQGDIGRFSDKRIAAGMDWKGRPNKLITALKRSGFVEQSDRYRLVVHDWHDHADDAVKKRLSRAKTTFLSYQQDTGKVTGHYPDMSPRCPDLRLDNGGLARALMPKPLPCPTPTPSASAAGGRRETASAPAPESMMGLDLWDELIRDATRANMATSAEESARLKAAWRVLDFEQKQAAITGIQARITSGEYDDPAYVPTLLNYVHQRKWKLAVRNKRAANGEKAAQMERI